MTRFVVWHAPNPGAPLPTYYVDRPSKPIAVRINAERRPDAADLLVDILDDGVSIMKNSPSHANLPKKANSNEVADDFITSVEIAEGSWLSCTITDNGAQNVTVQLELEELGESTESRNH